MAAVKHIFNDGKGTGDDDELTIYGVNGGTLEIFYNKSMVSLGFFGRSSERERVFVEPIAIAADEIGNVYVSDPGQNAVIRLRNENNSLTFVGKSDGTETGKAFKSPAGVSVDGGRVFVADTGNDRVVELLADGRFVGEHGEGLLLQPFAVAAIASKRWSYFGDSFMAVTDSSHQRLVLFSMPEGDTRSITYDSVSGAGGGFYFVAIDYYSNVYVTDPVGGCIYKFDRYLNYLTRIGCGTGIEHDLVEPRGIAIYRRFGQIFVAEKEGASYFWVGSDVENLRCTVMPKGDDFVIRTEFLLTEHATLDISLTTDPDQPGYPLSENLTIHAGRHVIQYRIPAGEIPCQLANCTYGLVVRARPTYSSREYFSVERRVRARLLPGVTESPRATTKN